MRAKMRMVACCLFTVMSFVGAAQAEEPKASTTERGYAYTFEDDPLDAAPLGANGDRIAVRRGAKRTLLLRPRTHFIRELFQSAENL